MKNLLNEIKTRGGSAKPVMRGTIDIRLFPMGEGRWRWVVKLDGALADQGTVKGFEKAIKAAKDAAGDAADEAENTVEHYITDELGDALVEGRIDWAEVEGRIPKGYKLGKNLQGKALKKGMKVAAVYSDFNKGVDFNEILGVSGNDVKYGKGAIRYASVQEALKANGVKTLKALEAKDDETSKTAGYGHRHQLCIRDMHSRDKGCWYYLYNGRWARGSGAEKLTFVELEKA